jgi:hypothetical protein
MKPLLVMRPPAALVMVPRLSIWFSLEITPKLLRVVPLGIVSTPVAMSHSVPDEIVQVLVVASQLAPSAAEHVLESTVPLTVKLVGVSALITLIESATAVGETAPVGSEITLTVPVPTFVTKTSPMPESWATEWGLLPAGRVATTDWACTRGAEYMNAMRNRRPTHAMTAFRECIRINLYFLSWSTWSSNGISIACKSGGLTFGSPTKPATTWSDETEVNLIEVKSTDIPVLLMWRSPEMLEMACWRGRPGPLKVRPRRGLRFTAAFRCTTRDGICRIAERNTAKINRDLSSK